jgi:hypothetical protein
MAGVRFRAAVAIVALHYVVNLAHGAVHGVIPIALTTPQTAFVVLVVTLGPLLVLWGLRRGRTALGWAALATILAAAFVFSVAFHYVVASPDHVAHVPAGPWNLPFEVTAGAVAVVDGGGALLAGWFAVQAHSEGRTAAIDSTN